MNIPTGFAEDTLAIFDEWSDILFDSLKNAILTLIHNGSLVVINPRILKTYLLPENVLFPPISGPIEFVCTLYGEDAHGNGSGLHSLSADGERYLWISSDDISDFNTSVKQMISNPESS